MASHFWSYKLSEFGQFSLSLLLQVFSWEQAKIFIATLPLGLVPSCTGQYSSHQPHEWPLGTGTWLV